MKQDHPFVLLLVAALMCASTAAASDLDEFKVKREAVFEFVRKPVVRRTDDGFEIEFETKGYCDVTVAIEEAAGSVPKGVRNPPKVPDTLTNRFPLPGRIVRHLGSGVLGPNAPDPFQRNSKQQRIVWDGKDDRGEYIDETDDLTIRVSLGLKPRYERTLFWSPHKRAANVCPLVAACEEGVLVFEGRGADHLLLFDHDGNYVRTIYPFPAAQMPRARGLDLRTFEQDGKTLPVKKGFVQATLLTSGTSCLVGLPYKFGNGYGATVMATAKGRIALGYDRINRLALDGSTGGLTLTGQKIGRRIRSRGYGGFGVGENIIGPASMAFSPDGKTLYLTGFMWREFYHKQSGCLHGVLKIDFEGDAEPEVFAGEMKTYKSAGADNAHFRVPTSVACDARGRVYVSDFMNDRIQVFAPSGAFVKSIPSPKPAKVLVSPKTGEIWVFSWPVFGVSDHVMLQAKAKFDWRKIKPILTRYGPLEAPKRRSVAPLPIGFNTRGFFLTGPVVDVAVDWYAEQPTLWVAARKYDVSRIDVAWGGVGAYGRRGRDPWQDAGVRILGEKDGQWLLKRAFGKDAARKVKRTKPADFGRQRLYINPRNRKLYVGEDLGFGKSFKQAVEIDPETGRIELITLPFDTEDLAFDIEGRAYLRTDTLVVRYDSETWQEIPWDYGEERDQVGFSSLGGGHRAYVRSGLRTPGKRPVCWHAGGMSVSATGLLAVANCSRAAKRDRGWMDRYAKPTAKPYTPTLYPGRVRWGEVHVWDARGRILHEDAIPGLTILDGFGIDKNGDLYVMAAPTRIFDGKRYFNEMSETLIKIAPGEGKVLSVSGRAQVPLAKEDAPKRDPEVANSQLGRAWVQNAKWFYGGLGFAGFNPSHSGGGCACWNARFSLDYFARSFAPETDHYSVAVLDTNGNLILRVGQYGNVDDGLPLIADGGPPDPQSIGGDEVGLFHACYVGTDTDRRLFIADTGNSRIVSVRLGYHTTEHLPLRNVPSGGR